MKNVLILLSVIALTSCMKKYGPDETMTMQGNDLRLPPEYSIEAPEDVKTIKTTSDSVSTQSQKILLNGAIKGDNNENINSWLIKNAGGDKRIKNIKNILKDDLKEEKDK